MAAEKAQAPVKEPKAKPEPKSPRGLPKMLPPYHVVLLDDDDHTHEYVIEMLKSLFGHPQELGLEMAKEVDESGRAIVYTTHKEKAEFKRDQIHSFGPDVRCASCAGAMSAVIEPADG